MQHNQLIKAGNMPLEKKEDIIPEPTITNTTKDNPDRQDHRAYTFQNKQSLIPAPKKPLPKSDQHAHPQHKLVQKHPQQYKEHNQWKYLHRDNYNDQFTHVLKQ